MYLLCTLYRTVAIPFTLFFQNPHPAIVPVPRPGLLPPPDGLPGGDLGAEPGRGRQGQHGHRVGREQLQKDGHEGRQPGREGGAGHAAGGAGQGRHLRRRRRRSHRALLEDRVRIPILGLKKKIKKRHLGKRCAGEKNKCVKHARRLTIIQH